MRSNPLIGSAPTFSAGSRSRTSWSGRAPPGRARRARRMPRHQCPPRPPPLAARRPPAAPPAATAVSGTPASSPRRLPRHGNGAHRRADRPVEDRRARAAIRGQCPPETRAFPHAAAMASPPVYELPEPKHSSWRVWTPVTLTSTVFGLRTLTLKVRRVRPSPTSSTPAWNWGGDLAASPIVAWKRRALCSSLYAGKAVWSPTLQ